MKFISFIRKIKKNINYLKNIILNDYYYILNYSKIKKSREIKIKKGVVYTCITGGYDKPIIHKYFDNNWDYIFFTDDKDTAKKKKIGMWKIVYIEDKKRLENHYVNRWYKMNPHKLFSNYDYSAYIDGNIRILNKNFFQDIEKKIEKNQLFSAPLHPLRNCLYEEANICKKLKLDKKEIIENTIIKYTNEEFPKNFGLYEANILFRKHNNKSVINLMENWWEMIHKFSRRDQLSLTYCMWKNGINFNPLNDKPYRNDRVKVLSHGKKYKLFD